MIETGTWGDELQKLGFSSFVGVPCSYLKSLINYAINECDYIGAANEGDAVAIASGASLGGKKTVVLMQNSGLTNAVSPLASLNYPFRIPLLGFIGLRGEPGKPDEPQHQLMGQITTRMLDLLNIRHAILSDDPEQAKQQLAWASQEIELLHPFFFVVRKDTFTEVPLLKQEHTSAKNVLKKKKTAPDELPSRYDALAVIHSLKDDKTVLLATTGKTGRELYDIADAPGHLYIVGSMGCVGSLGLGLARSVPDLDVVTIDGDGSLLMRMGSLATIGFCHPPNLLHILLDNNAHDSTGGQRTVSHQVDFAEIAASCNYRSVGYAHNLDELRSAISEWKRNKGLTFIHMRIAPGSKQPLGRPTIQPYEINQRLQRFITDHRLRRKD
ncbi:phosphonopyruvate decarboxylase [Paenibacillus hamazuiensis]|uniref:phosphonopyruvate decarboxylase n=1 Tax=Paenibacillus hamazuiensis TaxID=2936508 RepID=UPI00200D6382|nr:phosphonopyruvate decarboxylase [Paenibacillus hamazuiensis]